MIALLSRREDGQLELRCPGVGYWRDVPPAGTLVRAGTRLGRLEVLGQLTDIVAPDGAHGIVVELGGASHRTRRPMAYDDLLLTLDPKIAGVAAEAATASDDTAADLVFRAPSSGRFYARPSPDKPAFIAAGDTVEEGQTIAVLEVMKTFNRIQYGGTGLPAKARVIRIVPADGDDLEAGAPLLELEAL